MRREYPANYPTMTTIRTAVFVMLSLAGSPSQMASRQVATVLNRLGGIGERDGCPGMPLGAAKGEPPMGEHNQRLGARPDTKHPMRRTKVSKSKSKLPQACDEGEGEGGISGGDFSGGGVSRAPNGAAFGSLDGGGGTGGGKADDSAGHGEGSDLCFTSLSPPPPSSPPLPPLPFTELRGRPDKRSLGAACDGDTRSNHSMSPSKVRLLSDAAPKSSAPCAPMHGHLRSTFSAFGFVMACVLGAEALARACDARKPCGRRNSGAQWRARAALPRQKPSPPQLGRTAFALLMMPCHLSVAGADVRPATNAACLPYEAEEVFLDFSGVRACHSSQKGFSILQR